MSKHTPGPWRLNSWQITGNGATIADLRSWPNETLMIRLEAEANARLIAAAPELLEALRGVMRWMPVYPNAADGILGGRGAYDAAVDRALEAIAKATGVQP